MDPRFTSNQYKILETMYDNMLIVEGEQVCPLGQKDISVIMEINRMTVNQLVQELKNDGYIISEGRQRYRLSDYATKLIEMTKNI